MKVYEDEWNYMNVYEGVWKWMGLMPRYEGKWPVCIYAALMALTHGAYSQYGVGILRPAYHLLDIKPLQLRT